MGPSSPYYLFGAQRRYAYAWHGRPGGVPDQYRAATTRGMGNADMVESGYETSNAFFPNVAFNHTSIHSGIPRAISGLGDWPLIRQAGLEPHDPNNDGLGLFDGLSDNEKKLLWLGGAAAIALFLWRRSRRARRNPESSHARRLRKLRALASSSPNQHEAALAAQRADELAQKHPPRKRRRKATKRRKPAKRRRPAPRRRRARSRRRR